MHTGITLVTGNEDRQWLYAAMTRGTDNNLVFVSTTPGEGRRPRPRHPARPRTGTVRAAPAGTRRLPPRPARRRRRAGRTRASRSRCSPTSSTATAPSCRPPKPGQRNLANADHLAVLGAIWTAETRHAHDTRYRDLVMAALPPEYRQELSHQARWLYRTLRSAELAGLDPAEVARAAIAVPGPGRRPRHRRRDRRPHPPARLPAAPPAARTLGRARPPATRSRTAGVPGRDRRDDGRPQAAPRPARRRDRARLGGQRPSARSPKTRPPGRTGSARRPRSAPTGRCTATSHPDDPIGPEPSHDSPDQRAAWHEAFLALGPADGPDVRGMPDGRLWLIRDTYAAETCWAPRHVGKELRLVRLGAANAELDAIRSRRRSRRRPQGRRP